MCQVLVYTTARYYCGRKNNKISAQNSTYLIQLKKRKWEVMVTQYEPSLPPAIYVFILNKVFQFHQMGTFKQTQLGLPSVHSSRGRYLQSVHWIYIFLDMPRQQRQGLSSKSSSSVLHAFFLFIFALCCCEPLFRYVARFRFLFYRPSSSSICFEPCVVGCWVCRRFWQRYQSKWQLFFDLVYILASFAYGLGRFRTSCR